MATLRSLSQLREHLGNRDAPLARDNEPRCSEEAPTYTPCAVEFARGAD
jgi:hypothetical protein